MFKLAKLISRVGPLLMSKWGLFSKNYRNRNKISLIKRYNDLRETILKFTSLAKIDLIVSGRKSLPCEQSYVLTPNHQSALDAVMLIQYMQQNIAFVSKVENLKLIYIGKAMGTIDCLYLERDNLRQEIEVMKEVKRSLLNDNKKWVIFPEGTRTTHEDHHMNEFKPGAFKMATIAKVDIYPVALWGSFRILDLKDDRYDRFPIYLHVCDPITYDQYKDLSTVQLSELVHSIVENKVEELRKIDEENLNKYLKKKYQTKNN